MGTIFWYDYETFGTNPALDQPSQIGAIRTDEDLNIIGEPFVRYCQPTSDRLPSPAAVLITGITPQQALADGVRECEFARSIEAELLTPGTISSGYNTIRFDDEFTRYLFYRNMLLPYAREWGEGRGRWDLIDVVRATRALRPEGLEWPVDIATGKPTNKLDILAPANGIDHTGAHEALADVKATIELARLLKSAQPKLYDFGWQLKDKKVALEMLSRAYSEGEPLVHSSNMFKSEYLNTSVVYVLGQDPVLKNKWLVFDLRYDPSQFADLSPEELRIQAFAPEEERAEDLDRMPVKGVHANKSPFIAPLATVTDAASARIQLEISQAMNRATYLNKNPDFKERILQALSSTADPEKADDRDVEEQLYGGAFWSNSDALIMQRIRANGVEEMQIIAQEAKDPRIPQLVRRMRARNYPNSLSPSEHQSWEKFRSQRLIEGLNYHRPYSVFAKELQECAQQNQDPDKTYLLQELQLYAESIYPVVEED